MREVRQLKPKRGPRKTPKETNVETVGFLAQKSAQGLLVVFLMAYQSLAYAMCADGDMSCDNAECVRETARCVLETISPIGAYDCVAWGDLLVNSAKASVCKQCEKDPSEMGSMVLSTLMVGSGNLVSLNDLRDHTFAINLRRQLPLVLKIVQDMLGRTQYDQFKARLSQIQHDIEVVMGSVGEYTAEWPFY